MSYNELSQHDCPYPCSEYMIEFSSLKIFILGNHIRLDAFQLTLWKLSTDKEGSFSKSYPFSLSPS